MIRFLVVGDWGRRGASPQCAVAEGLARAARRLAVHRVISTGDNFYEDGVQSVRDAHWQESFESIYTARALQQVPWHVALGNHDYRGTVEAQVAYTRRSRRWHLPGRYYDFTVPVDERTQAQFIVLDTTPFLSLYQPGGAEATEGVAEQDTRVQLRWLRRTLARSEAEWKIVVGHHPLRSGSPFHGDAEELRSAVLPELQAGGVQVYLAGHEHDLQHLAADGLQYVISGAGSECRATGATEHTRFSQASLGFAAVELCHSRLVLRFYDAAGRPLYRAEVPRTPAQKQVAVS